jgi:hypothetical protein
MPIYECDYCNYKTTIKTQYNRHLNTQKHINKLKEIDGKFIKLLEKSTNEHKMSTNEHKMSTNEHKMSTNEHKMSTNEHKKSINELSCRYCNKLLTTIPIKRRHELYYCKKNLERKEIENNKVIKEIENKYKEELKYKEEIELKYKEEIEKLHQKIEILILQKNTPTIINIDKQINLNNYGSEDLSHITENFKDQMLKIPFVAIPKMIEEVHFSEKKPENNNIKLTNKKENYVKVYQGDKWIFKDRKSTIKQLMDDKYTIIDNHYEEYKEEPKPKHVDSQYNKFKEMYNEGDRDLHNEIRLDCELLLLNNMDA